MKKNKRFFTLAIVAMFGVIAAVVGTTAAWFTSTASATGTITTGQITSKIKIGTNEYTGSSNNSAVLKSGVVMPGDSVCDAISVQATCTDSRGVYMRVSISASGTTATITPAIASGWTLSSSYYYYGTSATALTAVTSSSYISFCTGASFPTSAGNTDQNKTVTVTITLQVTQVANNSTPSWS